MAIYSFFRKLVLIGCVQPLFSLIPQSGLPEGVLTFSNKECLQVARSSGSPVGCRAVPPAPGPGFPQSWWPQNSPDIDKSTRYMLQKSRGVFFLRSPNRRRQDTTHRTARGILKPVKISIIRRNCQHFAKKYPNLKKLQPWFATSNKSKPWFWIPRRAATPHGQGRYCKLSNICHNIVDFLKFQKLKIEIL